MTREASQWHISMGGIDCHCRRPSRRSVSPGRHVILIISRSTVVLAWPGMLLVVRSCLCPPSCVITRVARERKRRTPVMFLPIHDRLGTSTRSFRSASKAANDLACLRVKARRLETASVRASKDVHRTDQAAVVRATISWNSTTINDSRHGVLRLVGPAVQRRQIHLPRRQELVGLVRCRMCSG